MSDFLECSGLTEPSIHCGTAASMISTRCREEAAKSADIQRILTGTRLGHFSLCAANDGGLRQAGALQELTIAIPAMRASSKIVTDDIGSLNTVPRQAH